MLEGLKDKITKIADSLNENKLLHDTLEDANLQQEIIELNRKQLLDGRGSDNNELPKYVDDPFFKTQKAAKAYQAWKSKVSPNPNKNAEVMDFYINGQFHSTITMKNNDDSFEMVSNSSIASDVQSKTGNEALGLNEVSLGFVIPEIKNKLLENVKEKFKI